MLYSDEGCQFEAQVTGGLGGSHTAPRGTVVPARPPTRRALESRGSVLSSMDRLLQKAGYAGLVLECYRNHHNLRTLGLPAARSQQISRPLAASQFFGVAEGMLLREVFPFSRRKVTSFVWPFRSGTFLSQSE